MMRYEWLINGEVVATTDDIHSPPLDLKPDDAVQCRATNDLGSVITKGIHYGRETNYFITEDQVKRGSANHNAKLDEDAARDIYTSNESQRSLAKKYGVNASTISSVKSRRSWARATQGLEKGSC